MSKKITIEEIAKKFGVSVNEVEIIAKTQRPLSEVERKKPFTLGTRDWVVGKHLPDGWTAVMTKEFYLEGVQFDEETPNFAKAEIKEKLQPLFDELKAIIGEENICKHTVDLTTLNGMKDNGSCETYISIPTLDFARENIDIFIEYKDCVDDWEWLANAWATEDTGWKYGVCVLSPACNFGNFNCNSQLWGSCVLYLKI